MKRKIALGFSILLTVISLAGCKELPVNESRQSISQGGSSDVEAEWVPEEGAVLKFRSGDKEFAAAAARMFQEKYDVEVKTEEGGAYDFSKGVLEGATGEGPDVFMSPHDKMPEGIQAGLFLELDSAVAGHLTSEVSDVAMKTVIVDGKAYGVPVSIEVNVMFYNKALVTGEPASAYEQLEEEAEGFNNEKENKFWFLSDVSAGSPIYPMLSTYGFQLFGEDGTDEDNPGFDTPEFEKGLEVLADYRNLMPISSGDLANADFLTNQFMEGKTAYMIGGPWNVKTFREAGVDFGITELVTYDGRRQKPFAFVQNAHVSAYTKYPKAAQLFAEFLVSPECAGILYTKASKITSRADSELVEGLKDDAELLSITKAFESSVPMPGAKRISYYWTIAANIGPAVFDGRMTPEEGAKKAQEDWNAFLQTE